MVLIWRNHLAFCLIDIAFAFDCLCIILIYKHSGILPPVNLPSQIQFLHLNNLTIVHGRGVILSLLQKEKRANALFALFYRNALYSNEITQGSFKPMKRQVL